MLDGKIFTEMTSGACFGEIVFLATCKKVLRQHGCNCNLAVRVCNVCRSVCKCASTPTVNRHLQSVATTNLGRKRDEEVALNEE